MITGNVNLLRLPTIAVALIAGNGQRRTIEAHLDTGFSGDLTLPKVAIEQLQFPLLDRVNYVTGNGMKLFNVYDGIIHWRGGIRYVSVLETEIFPVVGVGLLWDNNLSIDFKHGGAVTITELNDA